MCTSQKERAFYHSDILYQSIDIFLEHPDSIKMSVPFFLSLFISIFFFFQQIRLQLEYS